MSTPELARLREEIDRLDCSLIRLIADRVRLARRIGAAKQAAGLPTIDGTREAAVLRRAVEHARESAVPYDDEIRQLFRQLIELSRRAQSDDVGSG